MASSRFPSPSVFPAFRPSAKLVSPNYGHLLTAPPRSRALRPAQSGVPDTTEISRGKIDRLPCTPAGFTTPVLDDRGLCDPLPARPAGSLSGFVHRPAALLHASFRPHLAVTPLRFANPLPSSGWVKDFHLQAVVHTRRTNDKPGRRPGLIGTKRNRRPRTGLA
jgi:hypothetical protein